MREVLDDLLKLVGGGRDRRRRHRRRDVPVRAAPAGRLDAGRPRRRGRRLGLRRLRRGRGLRARPVGGGVRSRRCSQRYGVSDDDAFAVGLTCGGILDVYVEKVNQRDLPRARRDRRRHRGRPPGRAGHRDRAPRPGVAGPADRRTPGGGGGLARQRARDRRGDRRRAGPARVGPQRHADLRTRRRAPRRGDAGLRVGVRAGAADAGLRRHRLRGRRGAGRRVPRLPRHRVRRPARLRHQHPLPARRRGGGQAGRTSTSRPRSRPAASTAARSSACSPTTPSSTYPCSSWRCGCPRSPTSARWARGAPTTTGWRGCARPGSPRTSWPGSPARSASTSARARPEETAVSIAAEIIAGRWGGTRRPALGHRRPHPRATHRHEQLPPED